MKNNYRFELQTSKQFYLYYVQEKLVRKQVFSYEEPWKKFTIYTACMYLVQLHICKSFNLKALKKSLNIYYTASDKVYRFHKNSWGGAVGKLKLKNDE